MSTKYGGDPVTLSGEGEEPAKIGLKLGAEVDVRDTLRKVPQRVEHGVDEYPPRLDARRDVYMCAATRSYILFCITIRVSVHTRRALKSRRSWAT